MTSYLTESIEDARLLNAQNDHNFGLGCPTYDLSRYEQKGLFDVIATDLNEWTISSESPTFLPDSVLIEYLEKGFFKSAVVVDEYNLEVTLLHPVSSVLDEDYIKESFDQALEWLPKKRAAEQAYFQMEEARERYQKAVQLCAA